MTNPRQTHPHDIGLSGQVVRKRRQYRKTAQVMLVVAVVTGGPAWYLFGLSFYRAVNVQHDPWQRPIFAYSLLIVSTITLLLGLWYLLLAQVRRIVGESHEEGEVSGTQHCPNCGWGHDPPDRYCRHCGKPLGAVMVARGPK